MKSKIVSYCPGGAPGSPAHMTEKEAKIQFSQDSAYIEVLKKAGALPKDTQLPHIGGKCSICSE